MLITTTFDNCFYYFSSLGAVVSLVASHYQGLGVIYLLLQANLSEIFLFCKI